MGRNQADGELHGELPPCGHERIQWFCHGFVYRDHQLHDLNAMLEPGTGWELVQALAINNRGEILGLGAREGEDRIVLLRPKV